MRRRPIPSTPQPSYAVRPGGIFLGSIPDRDSGNSLDLWLTEYKSKPAIAYVDHMLDAQMKYHSSALPDFYVATVDELLEWRDEPADTWPGWIEALGIAEAKGLVDRVKEKVTV